MKGNKLLRGAWICSPIARSRGNFCSDKIPLFREIPRVAPTSRLRDRRCACATIALIEKEKRRDESARARRGRDYAISASKRATYRRVAAGNCLDLHAPGLVGIPNGRSHRGLPRPSLTNRAGVSRSQDSSGRRAEEDGDEDEKERDRRGASNASRVCTLLPRTLLLQREASDFARGGARLTKWIAGTAISHEFRGAFVPVFLAALRVTYRY